MNELIKRSQQGDHEAFEMLLQQCQGLIYKKVNQFFRLYRFR